MKLSRRGLFGALAAAPLATQVRAIPLAPTIPPTPAPLPLAPVSAPPLVRTRVIEKVAEFVTGYAHSPHTHGISAAPTHAHSFTALPDSPIPVGLRSRWVGRPDAPPPPGWRFVDGDDA